MVRPDPGPETDEVRSTPVPPARGQKSSEVPPAWLPAPCGDCNVELISQWAAARETPPSWSDCRLDGGRRDDVFGSVPGGLLGLVPSDVKIVQLLRCRYGVWIVCPKFLARLGVLFQQQRLCCRIVFLCDGTFD